MKIASKNDLNEALQSVDKKDPIDEQYIFSLCKYNTATLKQELVSIYLSTQVGKIICISITF